MFGSAFIQNGWVFKGFSPPTVDFWKKNSGNLSSKCEILPGGLKSMTVVHLGVCLFLPKLWPLQSLTQTVFWRYIWEWLQKLRYSTREATKNFDHTKLQGLQFLGSPNFSKTEFWSSTSQIFWHQKTPTWQKMNSPYFSGGFKFQPHLKNYAKTSSWVHRFPQVEVDIFWKKWSYLVT